MEPEINLENTAERPRLTQTVSSWEQDAIAKLATAGLKEQQRSRRWGIFFKLLGFAYL